MGLQYPSSEWDPGSSSVLSGSGAYIGLVTVANNITLNSNITLNASSNFVGLVSTASINGKVDLATLIAGEDLTNDVQKVETRYSYAALTSLVTLTVKTGAGFIHNILVGGYSGPTIEIYDNTAASGTLIGRLVAAVPPGPYPINASFATGLTINPQPGTTILPSLTISYR